MPTIQVKDAGGTTIYLQVASGSGTSGSPYVLQDSIPTGSNAIGSVSIDSSQTVGLDAGAAAIGSLTAGTAAIGATKDNGPETAGTFTYTTSADITTAADIGPAPSGGQKSVILQAVISTDTAMQFTIQMETTAGAERQSWYLPASGSVIFVPRYPVKVGTADKKWQGIASVAGNVAISTVTTSEA